MPQTILETPAGPIALVWRGETLTGVDLDPPRAPLADFAEDSLLPARLPAAIRAQFAAYFADGTCPFDLPLQLDGTAFQQRVWALLRQIAPGETRTYGNLARVLGSAARAVGQACRANPCPIVVPCHRVVAVNGLGGFAGDRSGTKLAMKRWLLAHEGALAQSHDS